MGLSLFAKLGLDKTGFDAGMTAATKKANALGNDLKGALAGAFTVAAITTWVHSVAGAVERVKDLAEQTGLTTDEVQKADFALKQSGMTIEDMIQPMNKLGVARRDAVEGNDKLRESFAKFGFNVRDLNNANLRNFDILMMIAKAMGEGTVRADEQGFVMDILGVKAGKLANVLGTLATVKPPSLFEDRDIQKIDDAAKAMERFKLAAQVETGGAVGRWLDFWDLVTGKNRIKARDAAQAPTGLELEQAIAERNARNAAQDASKRDLFEVDKDKKKQAPGLFDVINQLIGHALTHTAPGGRVAAPGQIESDQFQRIGAFTGASAAQAQVDATRGMKSTLDRILVALESKGIRIKGTD